MHEVSLVEDLVGQVAIEAGRQAFSRVRVVRIRVGMLAAAQPHALRFCFAAVTRGTVAEGARLEIDTVPGRGWCGHCARALTIDDRYGACIECGNAPLTIIAGDEFQLAELEVD